MIIVRMPYEVYDIQSYDVNCSFDIIARDRTRRLKPRHVKLPPPVRQHVRATTAITSWSIPNGIEIIIIIITLSSTRNLSRRPSAFPIGNVRIVRTRCRRYLITIRIHSLCRTGAHVRRLLLLLLLFSIRLRDAISNSNRVFEMCPSISIPFQADWR